MRALVAKKREMQRRELDLFNELKTNVVNRPSAREIVEYWISKVKATNVPDAAKEWRIAVLALVKGGEAGGLATFEQDSTKMGVVESFFMGRVDYDRAVTRKHHQATREARKAMTEEERAAERRRVRAELTKEQKKRNAERANKWQKKKRAAARAARGLDQGEEEEEQRGMTTRKMSSNRGRGKKTDVAIGREDHGGGGGDDSLATLSSHGSSDSTTSRTDSGGGDDDESMKDSSHQISNPPNIDPYALRDTSLGDLLNFENIFPAPPPPPTLIESSSTFVEEDVEEFTPADFVNEHPMQHPPANDVKVEVIEIQEDDDDLPDVSSCISPPPREEIITRRRNLATNRPTLYHYMNKIPPTLPVPTSTSLDQVDKLTLTPVVLLERCDNTDPPIKPRYSTISPSRTTNK
ncbi:uncharacterized protein LOC110859578 [Folsomia candida]|nr:uncharacterized protein LOC110859578 [Folsomia candida]